MEENNNPKSERRKKFEKKSPPSKKDMILASRMPKWQKHEAMVAIGEIEEQPMELAGKVSFKVYAKVKRVNPRFHSAMMAYPTAVDVELASLMEWDEIFKGF